MKRLYEFTGSWKHDGRIQIAYVYVNAENKIQAQRAILSSVPYDIDLERPKRYAYSKSIANSVKLWYFDENGQEHHDKFNIAEFDY